MQKTFILRSALFSIFVLLMGSIDWGSYAEEESNVNLYFPTHKEIPKPLPIQDTNNLLVSLEQYLGRDFSDNSKTISFDFLSNGRPLILEDANGLVHKSSKITIGWRNVLLDSPKTFVRQVIGPFSSFESAQRIAVLLDQDGIENIIAHPSDWEIWVSNKIKLPKGLKFKLFKQNVLSEVKPVLKLDSGSFLLAGDIQIIAPDGLIWKEGLYSGPFLLKPDAYGTWTLIEKVPIEKYLLGVLPHEMGRNSPVSALSAQAVLARTWAIANSHRFEIDGYHLCSDTQCQVYRDPNKANDEVALAIRNTQRKVLMWKGKPINAVYHATNGGVSAGANEAWSISPLPYLKPFLDGSTRWENQFSIPLQERSNLKRLLIKRDGAYGNNHHLFRWKRIIKDKEIKKALESKNFQIGIPRQIKVIERGKSGRVLSLEIVGDTEKSKIVLRLDQIRGNLRNLPSTLFYVEEIKKGVWEFTGGGFGHGVGMSQAGAIDLALRGWTTRKILNHYYPGTTYETFK